VYAVARDDVWAVSNAGQTAHFDGSGWSAVTTPFRGWLLAVWGARSNDVWAVGGGEDGTNTGRAALDRSGLDGGRAAPWTNLEALGGHRERRRVGRGELGDAAALGRRALDGGRLAGLRGLNGLWARARDDVWAVGEDGVVLRFDGQRWAGAKPDWRWLRGVTGTPSQELFAVGAHGLVLHFRGEGLRLQPPLPPWRPPLTRRAGSDPALPRDGPRVRGPLRRARQLLAEGRIEAASGAFIAASGKDQVINVRPIVERAHMLLTRGEGTSVPFTLDELAGELEAGTVNGDAELEAQAWYNLSLLYARRGEAERERAALGRSLLRREQPSVRAKLGAAPRAWRRSTRPAAPRWSRAGSASAARSAAVRRARRPPPRPPRARGPDLRAPCRRRGWEPRLRGGRPLGVDLRSRSERLAAVLIAPSRRPLLRRQPPGSKARRSAAAGPPPRASA
jgi:hypothetical protein